MVNHTSDMLLTRLQLFEIIFPVKWLKDTVLENLNECMEIEVSYGELLQFIVMRLKIGTTVGFARRDF